MGSGRIRDGRCCVAPDKISTVCSVGVLIRELSGSLSSFLPPSFLLLRDPGIAPRIREPEFLLCGGRERGRLSQRTNVLRVAGLLQADLHVDMPVLMYVVAQEEDGVPRAVTPVESAPSKVLLLLT